MSAVDYFARYHSTKDVVIVIIDQGWGKQEDYVDFQEIKNI